MHKFTWVSSAMPKFRKNLDTIPQKHPDIRAEGWTEGGSDPIS